MRHIDLNCDLGEGGGHDPEIMPLISSCNIACGGHFGDQETVTTAVKLAMENNVLIGAHPSYPDVANFGRKSVKISLSALRKTISEQIERVFKAAKIKNGAVRHIKPHGALYNDLKEDFEKSELIVDLVRKFDRELILFVPPNSAVGKLAQGKLKTMVEGFADRKYEANFRLAPRKKKGAVLTDKNAILHQILTMVKHEKIPLENGSFLSAKFDTICMHGDNPNCVEILRYLNLKLPENGIQISGK